mgnify:CR=1 FL=1
MLIKGEPKKTICRKLRCSFNTLKKHIARNPALSQYVKDKTEEIWRTNSFVNEINRNILHYINNGYKINEIAEELSVSESTIKKRISKIKQSLELKEHDNLLKETKKRGYM